MLQWTKFQDRMACLKLIHFLSHNITVMSKTYENGKTLLQRLMYKTLKKDTYIHFNNDYLR